MKMRRPIVDSIVGCSDTAVYLGPEIDLFPSRGKTLRKRITLSGSTWCQSAGTASSQCWHSPTPGFEDAPFSLDTEGSSMRNVSPAVHFAMHRDGDTVAESSRPL